MTSAVDWATIALQTMDALPSLVAVVDGSGTIVAVNAAWRRFAALNGATDAESCEGCNVFDVCASSSGEGQSSAAQLAVGLHRVLDGASPAFEMDQPCATETRVTWSALRISPLDLGGSRMAVLVYDDITARKQMEAKLRETQEAHDRAQALTRSGSWRADFDSQTFTPSLEGARLLGWTPGPHSFAELFALIHPDDRERQGAAWMQALRERTIFDLEHRMMLQGEERWVRVLAEFEFSAEGRAIVAYGVTQDITEIRNAEAARTELEQQLRQAHKLEAIGLLAGGIAHDFNNLLTVIGGNSELLKPHVAGPEATHLLTEIRDAGDRAGALTRQLLAFSRSQVLAPTVVPVNMLIRRIESIVSRIIGEDITCERELAPDAGHVRVDAGQFEQVMLNLAVNARDAMPAGGRLLVRTRPVVVDALFHGVNPDLQPGAYVEISMADTGSGMPPDVMARIFEPFYTTKDPGRGTGLGLSMAFGIIKQSGGHLDVSSRVGEGATFTILLPQVNPPVELAAGPAADGLLAQGHETILLVEDEASVRKLARIALERAGYTVLVAEHGGAALELAGQYAGRIDMLVSDVVMPEMRGPDLARALEPRRPGLRVLFVSGYVQDAFDRAGVSEGHFLLKPFTLKELSDRVRAILDVKN